MATTTLFDITLGQKAIDLLLMEENGQGRIEFAWLELN